MKRIFKSKQVGIFLVLVAMMVVFSIASPAFFQWQNIFNIARQNATLGIVSVGCVFVLITGGIDLSIGYQISLMNVLCAFLMVRLGVPPAFAAIISILVGTAVGFLNGFLITRTRVAPIIVTLSMMNILHGISYLLSKGMPIFGFPKSFSVLGQGSIGLIPISFVIMLCIVLIGVIILKKTYFGRYFYAIGSNEEAAALSGVKVTSVRVLAYGLCGLFTAIAAIVTLSRVNSGQPLTGVGFEFDVITACIVGGVSTNGGKGTMLGAFIGVWIMGILDNGLLLLNIGEYVQLVIKGVVLMTAVTYDTMSLRHAEKVKRLKAINPEE